MQRTRCLSHKTAVMQQLVANSSSNEVSAIRDIMSMATHPIFLVNEEVIWFEQKRWQQVHPVMR